MNLHIKGIKVVYYNPTIAYNYGHYFLTICIGIGLFGNGSCYTISQYLYKTAIAFVDFKQ